MPTNTNPYNYGPQPPNTYNPYGPPLPNNGNYTPPNAGQGAPPAPGNVPAPPMGWPAHLSWQGQPPGQTGNYGGYTPPAPAFGGGAAGGGGGGGGGPEMWNGYEVLMRGPGGNVLVSVNGVPTAYDAWGNLIPHLNAGYEMDGSPSPQQPGAGGTSGGIPAPPPSGPATFYAPTTGSPYLQLPGNWLSYLDEVTRMRLDEQLQSLGFNPTGAMSTYGPSDYLRPVNFDSGNLAAIGDETIRNWLQFFLGDYGYGISYQLPASYTGTGLPTPPAPPSTGGTGS